MSRVAICLFNESISRFSLADCLTGQTLTKRNLTVAAQNALLYIKPSSSNTPDWVSVVGGFASLSGINVSTAASGAILFLEINQRVFGVCFGSVVANIQRDNIVNDFGLAAAYLRISKSHFKEIETTTITNNPVTNNRIIAIPSFQESFNVDTMLESITELSGKFFSPDGSMLIKGKQFYSSLSPATFNDIQTVCTDLLRDYLRVSADPNYIKATSIRKVKEKALIKFLDDRLLREMRKQSQNVFAVDFETNPNIHTYSLTPKGQKLDELTIADIYGALSTGSALTIENIKQRRIYVFDGNAQPLPQWSVYKCLLLERDIAGRGHYVLYKGFWYRIEDNFIQSMKQNINDVEVSSASLKLPVWKTAQSENTYNKTAASAIAGQCWDKTLYTNTSFPYGIEFCDILDPNYIIHVKKAGSSALNSHLLLQTAVSAQLLRSDPDLLKWIHQQSRILFSKQLLLNSSKKLRKAPTYLILLLAKNKTSAVADTIPFFSLVSFNLMITKIQSMGYQVRVAKA